MQNNIIHRKLLREFLREKHLHSVVAFLNFIKKGKSNLNDFFDFCGKHDQVLFQPAHGNILFHGSGKAQKFLRPNASVGFGGKRERRSYVYATNDPNYAIFLATLNLRNGSASVNAQVRNTMLFVDLDFVNGPSKLTGGYVHIVKGEQFKKYKNREYRSGDQVNATFIIPVVPADLTVPIYILTE